MKIKDIVLAIATLVGLFVIGAWVFRELGYFFNNLLYWLRYRGLYMVGAVAVLWIIGSLLFGREKS